MPDDLHNTEQLTKLFKSTETQSDESLIKTYGVGYNIFKAFIDQSDNEQTDDKREAAYDENAFSFFDSFTNFDVDQNPLVSSNSSDFSDTENSFSSQSINKANVTSESDYDSSLIEAITSSSDNSEIVQIDNCRQSSMVNEVKSSVISFLARLHDDDRHSVNELIQQIAELVTSCFSIDFDELSSFNSWLINEICFHWSFNCFCDDILKLLHFIKSKLYATNPIGWNQTFTDIVSKKMFTSIIVENISLRENYSYISSFIYSLSDDLDILRSNLQDCYMHLVVKKLFFAESISTEVFASVLVDLMFCLSVLDKSRINIIKEYFILGVKKIAKVENILSTLAEYLVPLFELFTLNLLELLADDLRPRFVKKVSELQLFRTLDFSIPMFLILRYNCLGNSQSFKSDKVYISSKIKTAISTVVICEQCYNDSFIKNIRTLLMLQKRHLIDCEKELTTLLQKLDNVLHAC